MLDWHKQLVLSISTSAIARQQVPLYTLQHTFLFPKRTPQNGKMELIKIFLSNRYLFFFSFKLQNVCYKQYECENRNKEKIRRKILKWNVNFSLKFSYQCDLSTAWKEVFKLLEFTFKSNWESAIGISRDVFDFLISLFLF